MLLQQAQEPYWGNHSVVTHILFPFFPPPKVHFIFPTRISQRKAILSGNAICLAASRRRRTASRPALNPSSILAGYSGWISPLSSPFISFDFLKHCFTAKLQFYGVISNAKIPVNLDKGGAGVLFLCGEWVLKWTFKIFIIQLDDDF